MIGQHLPFDETEFVRSVRIRAVGEINSDGRRSIEALSWTLPFDVLREMGERERGDLLVAMRFEPLIVDDATIRQDFVSDLKGFEQSGNCR